MTEYCTFQSAMTEYCTFQSAMKEYCTFQLPEKEYVAATRIKIGCHANYFAVVSS